jgi:guanylate kinase
MKIILIGKGCSGKDFLSSHLEFNGLKKSIAYTTRPKRLNEIDGKDYHFISKDLFESMIELNKFYEYDNFNNWYYGSSKEDHINKNLFIKTPKGISKIRKDDRKDYYIIYLNISDDIIRKRMLLRNDNNDVLERRILSDIEQFKNFNNYDLEITNENYDVIDISLLVDMLLNVI